MAVLNQSATTAGLPGAPVTEAERMRQIIALIEQANTAADVEISDEVISNAILVAVKQYMRDKTSPKDEVEPQQSQAKPEPQQSQANTQIPTEIQQLKDQIRNLTSRLASIEKNVRGGRDRTLKTKK